MTSGAKTLVIVESPAKAKTIYRILGSGYRVMASVGHVIDLPEKQLGVDIDRGFQPRYHIMKGKRTVLRNLKAAAAEAGEILLATDPDREGEAIAFLIFDRLRKVNPAIRRIEFNEITEAAVRGAVARPRDIDMPRVHAQQARRVMDRLVGYEISPWLWRSVHSGLSAGRVQSVALRLICEREALIEGFVPVAYWHIHADLQTPSGETFQARLVQVGRHQLDPAKWRIETAEEAQAHRDQISQESFQVSKISIDRLTRRPPPPFTTSTLQQDAARRFNISAAEVMSVAQSLYEGVALGAKGNVGLITYMRTDSTRIATAALQAARTYISEAYGTQILPEKAVRYAPRGSAQDAHEAIRPTHIEAKFEPRRLKSFLTPAQRRIYELIWTRFLASQLKPALADRKTIDVQAGDYLFRAVGETIVFQGYLTVYRPPEESDRPAEPASVLPSRIAEKDVLKLIELILKEKKTQPPPRYSESTLIKAMERLGIGRPSTFAQIIATLFDRQYVFKEERYLHPFELGRTVNMLLVRHFSDIFNIRFTAAMEASLDAIERREAGYRDTLAAFYEPLRTMLDNAAQPGAAHAASSDAPAAPERGEICRECGARMVQRQGKYGPFLSCSRFPSCRHTRPLGIGIDCPVEGCGGRLLEKKKRKGGMFYGCSEYPACDFALWNRPRSTPCAKCFFNLMEERVSRDGQFYLQCPQCKHREHIESIE